MSHRPMYRRLAASVWSVGCSCGWLCDHPLRGDRARAQRHWVAHREAEQTAQLGRQMTQRPVGPRGGAL